MGVKPKVTSFRAHVLNCSVLLIPLDYKILDLEIYFWKIILISEMTLCINVHQKNGTVKKLCYN